MYKVMSKGRGKDSVFGETAKSYAEEIVQTMIGVPQDDFVSYEMQWGIDNEPKAIKEYERKNIVKVYAKEGSEKARIFHPTHDFISGEPDGLIGKDGVLEVKCPNKNNHFKNLMEGKQLDDYKYQIQGYLWLTNRKWCDFISFNPLYPKKYQLAQYRVERDDAMIKELEERCILFWNELVLPIAKGLDEV
jgi:hypothetical protein